MEPGALAKTPWSGDQPQSLHSDLWPSQEPKYAAGTSPELLSFSRERSLLADGGVKGTTAKYHPTIPLEYGGRDGRTDFRAPV